MTKEEIIEMAREAGGYYSKKYPDEWRLDDDDLVRFAKLVAAQTLMKIDPSSFMSYQEGFEAGQLAEREECAKLCDYVYNNIVTDEHIKNMAFKIRARGQE